MFGIEKIDLTFSINPFLLVLFFLIAAGFTFFIYRYTVPVIDLSRKIFLILIRFTALLLMLFIVFEPMLTLAKKIVIEPVNLVFIDNSRSIKIDDGTKREETVRDFIDDIENNFEENGLQMNLFGNDVSQPDPEQLENINFSEGGTNFSNIFSFIDKQNKNISSVTIISDGVITDGSNPLYTAEKLNIPVFTIGVGDSSKRKDIEIRNVLFNEYIYAETPTTILTTINNTGFGGEGISVTLYGQNILVEQKNITLSQEGIQNIEFEYKPSSSGEKKLTLEASSLDGEFTTANNKKVFYVNVLDNKINILLLAGSPSSDISFIKNSLQTDDNFKVNSLTQISADKFLEKENPDRLLDSADILFLIGFPSKETSNNFLNKVQDKIFNGSIPFFLTLSSGIDFEKLNRLQRELPVNLSQKSSFYSEVQPNIIGNQSRNPLLQNKMQNPIAAWENLPPVFQPDIKITLKPESELIARSKIKNVPSDNPLIVSRKLGNKKSIALLAKEIWKWKLQTTMKDFDLFDRFIVSSVKWLNTTEDQKQVKISTSKKIYSLGEQVEFAAQVYDETFNPVSDSEVKVNITGNKQTSEIILSSVGNGLYEGVFETNKGGDYSFSGEAKLENVSLGKDDGSFNMGEVDIEMINPRMNYEFLSSLADRTGGEYFDQNNYSDLFPLLKRINENASKEKIETSEISLWSSEWLMAVIILLLGLEWFLRKRAGML
ncbi:MAG: hypothetical protein Q7S39_04485 [Ignavibacteria bacterium]|nr:hypothetical protein [Ignavibacteria bacterium]